MPSTVSRPAGGSVGLSAGSPTNRFPAYAGCSGAATKAEARTRRWSLWASAATTRATGTSSATCHHHRGAPAAVENATVFNIMWCAAHAATGTPRHSIPVHSSAMHTHGSGPIGLPPYCATWPGRTANTPAAATAAASAAAPVRTGRRDRPKNSTAGSAQRYTTSSWDADSASAATLPQPATGPHTATATAADTNSTAADRDGRRRNDATTRNATAANATGESEMSERTTHQSATIDTTSTTSTAAARSGSQPHTAGAGSRRDVDGDGGCSITARFRHVGPAQPVALVAQRAAPPDRGAMTTAGTPPRPARRTVASVGADVDTLTAQLAEATARQARDAAKLLELTARVDALTAAQRTLAERPCPCAEDGCCAPAGDETGAEPAEGEDAGDAADENSTAGHKGRGKKKKKKGAKKGRKKKSRK